MVSRVHCVVEERPDGWWLFDRSRHGTHVNGTPRERIQLKSGDQISIGGYQATFADHEVAESKSPTITVPSPLSLHEELVEVSATGYAAARAMVRFVAGPHLGRTEVMGQVRTAFGGPGAHVVIEASLPANALYLRVVRGRAMVEPGGTAVFLAGQRVREITPVMPGEEVRVGPHGFTVEVATIEEAARPLGSFGAMVGICEASRQLFSILQRVAGHDAVVLLTGESGTGKELAAKGIHEASPRSDGPFVAINCAAIADTLVESELFGHEKGAFTGATHRQDGAFQRAHGGTLFLDEIGEMKLEAQAKLLRALEGGEVRRVGGAVVEVPDVRVVAATNRNLPEMVRQGTFRGDLMHRLAILAIRLPPLRERKADIPHVARALLQRHLPQARLSDDAAKALLDYEWPGNVRELRNVLTRAVVLSGNEIVPGSLVFNPWSFDDEPKEAPAGPDPDDERDRLIAVLKKNGGNRSQSARDLGIPRSSLLYKIKRYQLGD